MPLVDALLSQIKSNNADLKTAELEGIIYLLLHEDNLTNVSLIQKTGLPKETLRRFKASIAPMLADLGEDKIQLNADYKNRFAALLLKPYAWSLLAIGDKQIAEAIDKLRSAHALQPKREYDQFFATPTTTAAKLEILKLKDQLTEKKIALLGDDDLLSTAIGLSNDNYSKVDVFEIDEKLITALETIAEKRGFKDINYIQYDVRNEPLQQFQGRYDVVVTDPPYTAAGITLFLNRTVQLIGNKENAYIFLYFGNSYKTPEKFIKVQDIIHRFGLVIEDKIDKFARYHGAESIGSASSLYILKTTKSTKPIESSILPRIIYTFENSKEEKFPYVDHVVIKALDVPKETLKSKTKLTLLLGEFCNKHRLKVVDTVITDFKGGGVTITYVLASSNLVVHTWPEYKALHVDLITCSPIYRKDLLATTVSELFKTAKIELTDIS